MARKKTPGSSTPATLALDRSQIPYTLHPYEHDDAVVHYGDEAAERLGVDPATIFKTLVLDSGAGLAVAVVPVARQLDLKAMANALRTNALKTNPLKTSASAGKKVSLADAHAAARSSGYVLGGISPIGQRTPLPTVIDDSARSQDLIMVSAGRRGLQVQLAPGDLCRVTAGWFAIIAR